MCVLAVLNCLFFVSCQDMPAAWDMQLLDCLLWEANAVPCGRSARCRACPKKSASGEQCIAGELRTGSWGLTKAEVDDVLEVPPEQLWGRLMNQPGRLRWLRN